MPFFATVGHIDDNLSQDDVMKEYRRRYSLASYHRRRAALVAQLGGKCALCAETTDLHLTRVAGAPMFRVSTLANMAEERRAPLLAHIELLCSEHTSERLNHKGQITHGTYYAAYKKKCRCEDCEEYMADYNLRRKEDRRAARSQC
jgi:hypothetical protein